MIGKVQRAFDALKRGRRFVTHDVWYIGRPGEGVPHGFVIKQVRVLILLVRNLLQGAFLMRAAALTFTSLLSVVPCVAILFIVIQKLNLGYHAVDFVTELASRVEVSEQDPGNPTPQPLLSLDLNEEVSRRNEEVIRRLLRLMFADVRPVNVAAAAGSNEDLTDPIEVLMKFAKDVSKTWQGANSRTVIALSGFVLVTVFGMMWNIESAFNSIWGVRRTRSWYRIFSDYLLIMLLIPFVVAAVLGFMIAMQSPADRRYSVDLALRTLPYLSIWAIFTLVYVIVPNTKVKWRYALLGGIIGGTLWCLGSLAYVNLQIGVTRNSLIYSSFALFPLLMTWIYVSWIIVLFGAELTFACQNERTFAMERLAQGASHAYREAVGLRAMVEVSRRFDEGLPGMATEDAAREWNVPTRVINETMNQLEEAGLVCARATEPITYAPARSLDKITVGDVVNALREAGREPSALREDESLRPLLAEIEGRGSRLMTASLDTFVRRFYPQHEAIEVVVSDSKELPSPE
ncbi:MAG: YihY family inner membrane protein [Candidatus Hydrogenedentes bacterium]|nr:YihY family inner membrane protein [Candidatus Hydrogenedentota bacterium]